MLLAKGSILGLRPGETFRAQLVTFSVLGSTFRRMSSAPLRPRRFKFYDVWFRRAEVHLGIR